MCNFVHRRFFQFQASARWDGRFFGQQAYRMCKLLWQALRAQAMRSMSILRTKRALFALKAEKARPARYMNRRIWEILRKQRRQPTMNIHIFLHFFVCTQNIHSFNGIIARKLGFLAESKCEICYNQICVLQVQSRTTPKA